MYLRPERERLKEMLASNSLSAADYPAGGEVAGICPSISVLQPHRRGHEDPDVVDVLMYIFMIHG